MYAEELIEFKSWIKQQIKNTLQPIFRAEGYKKGRTNCYIRERNSIVQFIQFEIKAHSVTVWPRMFPIYFPFTDGSSIGQILPQEERWIYTLGICARPVHKNGLEYIVTDEAAKKWGFAEKIITESIIPRFEKFQDLDELMAFGNYAIPDNDMWRGVKWYLEGVYSCLSDDFPTGIEMLQKAQKCKKAYVEFLNSVGSEFGKRGDQISVIYNYVDLFCDAMKSAQFDDDVFMKTYLQVCQDSRKWYKV